METGLVHSIGSKNDSNKNQSEKTIEIVPNPEINESDFLEFNTSWEPEDPLYMNKLPDEISDPLRALQAIKYDESDPEELADQYKEDGNELFKKGPKFYKMAIECYDKALSCGNKNPEKLSKYYTNRAAVNFELGNFGKVIEDCRKSIEIYPDYLKAYLRASKASCNLKKFEQSIEYLNKALELDPKNDTLKKELNKVMDLYKDYKEKLAILNSRKERIQKENSEAMKKKAKLIDTLLSKNIALGPYIFDYMPEYLKSSNSSIADGLDSYPVLFLYNQYNQSDFIHSFNINDRFEQHLKIMFPGSTTSTEENCYPQWDLNKEYSYSNLEIYAILNQVPAFKPKNAHKDPRKVRINHSTTLKKVLEHAEYVIPGYPIFYLVPMKSSYKEEFLKTKLIYGADYLTTEN